MSIIAAIIVFGFLIFFHELGHFLFAKLFGVYVEKFSIGFGPALFTRKSKETEYSISAIPLGGYVKMYGENLNDEVEESMTSRSFSHKSVGKRALIVLAGPVFNFLLAFLLFSLVNAMGTPKLRPVIGKVQKNMPAAAAGLQKGDEILKVNGKKIIYWQQISDSIKDNSNKPVTLLIKRGDDTIKKTIEPSVTEVKNIFGEKIKVSLIGIAPSTESTITVRHNPVKSVYLGAVKTYEITKLTIVGIVKIIQQVVPADNIGGPILIFQMAKETAAAGINSLLLFMAVISINLAILNLLPIPVLDGGHLLFYGIEAVKGKPVSLRTREVTQMVGLALLLALMVFAFYNDIARIISK
ncbi:MAG: RIP metalloprotease RseP [Flexistipes sinusarabici]|uniref:Zinc metalloprotease n=1 Tax=Flexistipes sinusarabici TaxID=2352 RepID=A0A5D0MTJ9_FLESI|nr:RIP metalloprotease RseP [Flexistipes sinusarabici]TYB35375.1 MAG: RIP metalloprotease RseP [Flexistipes sinusarabici]